MGISEFVAKIFGTSNRNSRILAEEHEEERGNVREPLV